MLKRKIYEYLVNWLNKDRRKSLIIDGPRQVGKTFVINEFLVNHFDENKIFYIDFRENYRMVRIFKRGLDISRIYQEINLNNPDRSLIEGESVIFFDNIQLCPEILPYFRAFTEDSLYPVIATCSSAEVMFKKVPKYPIGFFDRYHLGSMDFEEFLWANGYNEEQIEYFVDLHSKNEMKLSSLHGVLIDLFREYIAIGGMPKVVCEYIKQNNFKLAFDLQREIIDLYYNEMEEHSKHTMTHKIIECFDSIPVQLEKENKKFQYRNVSEKGRATMYKSSVEWLIDSGMVIKSNNLTKPIRPLNENKKDGTFKLYLHDPGLLISMYGEHAQLEILKGNFKIHNGAALENTVAVMLNRSNHDLYYFEKNSTLDIDFVLTVNMEVVPLIVKEADNNKSKSLKSLEEKYGIYNGIRLSSLSTLEGSPKNVFPIYMAEDMKK